MNDIITVTVGIAAVAATGLAVGIVVVAVVANVATYIFKFFK